MPHRHTVIPAVYILFKKDGKVLCILRKRTSYANGNYSLPAGHVEPHEPAAEAAAREAKEEVGVTVDPADLRLLHVQHRVSVEGDSERMNLLFEATKWEGEFANAEPEKCEELRWFAPDDMPDNLAPELRLMFDRLAQGHAYSDLGF